MPGETLQHVVKKTDAGVDIGPPGAVQLKRDGNIGLAGPALHNSLPCHGISSFYLRKIQAAVFARRRPFRRTLVR